MKAKIEGGLIVTGAGTCAGYVFNFERGAYDPNGLIEVDGLKLTQGQVDAHNKILADAELAALKKNGRGVLYLVDETYTQTMDNGSGPQEIKCRKSFVKQWAGKERFAVHYRKSSFHNMAGRDGRTDVWFMLDGSRWHGVNIGDNQLCRVKRCKS